MAIVIQKFGGSLLETVDHIRRAADYIIRTKKQGEDPVVVVSAPGSTTDRFLDMARQITETPDEREMDMLLSVGERMAMSLLAMAINSDGRYRAVSFTGSQIGIITDTHHTDARILEVKCLRIRETLARGEIPIVAGFQGVSTEKEITTLGRGGSDATAVAIASAMGAQRCELVKEKGAVYSADPDLVAEAVPLPEISYDILEALTSAGAGIVQPNAASLAKEHRVTLSITDPDGRSGTLVTDRNLEAGVVTAVILDEELHLTDDPANDMTSRQQSKVSFALWTDEIRLLAVKGIPSDDESPSVALVSVIGSGGDLSREVIGTLADTLANAGVTPLASTVSCGTLAVLVRHGDGRKALREIHKACIDKGFIKPVES